MSKKYIYNALRAGGLSRAGAIAMMGNIGAESAFKANNVEDRCPLSDFDYTHNVNTGAIPRWNFIHDAYGYGLCQWTFRTRKEALFDYAYLCNESIDDEQMQCRFIIEELKKDFASLYQYLCTTENLNEAVERICDIYENPAFEVRNLDKRIKIANECANEPYDDSADEDCGEDSCQIDIPETPQIDTIPESCDITVRVLQLGMKGRDVFIAQTAINDMGCSCGVPDGDFGPLTESGVRDLQQTCHIPVTGIVGQVEWQIIFS